MADAPFRLNLADQVLINLTAALCVRALVDPAQDDLLIGCMAEVLPEVQRAHPQMRPLAEAAARVVAVAPQRHQPGSDWMAACLALSGVLARVLMWRGGLALDAWRGAVIAPGADAPPGPVQPGLFQTQTGGAHAHSVA